MLISESVRLVGFEIQVDETQSIICASIQSNLGVRRGSMRVRMDRGTIIESMWVLGRFVEHVFYEGVPVFLEIQVVFVVLERIAGRTENGSRR